MRDAAGLTREDIAGLSQEQEFARVSERYAHLEALLAEAQHQISDADWEWISVDWLPFGGLGAVGGGLPGATENNSYYFAASRVLEVPGGSDDEAGLEPMRSYVVSKGWDYYTREMTGERDLWAQTGDGWWVNWSVRENGRYSLEVVSELFWSNDATELIIAIGGRSTTVAPVSSPPGVVIPFPKWEDSFTRPPIMRPPPTPPPTSPVPPE
ncbi:hypothetical protein [Rathayibacter tritici]|uniref:Uncharacterized protein n=2 Tax=Rathayibacter tritici TaxID=33888 RepID=A0A161IYN4_9MICO|nr:hypothetical protein [Rathayibacter tritici]AND15511.1 hypothetical protein A6122_0351 [Rathayibacter tritici]PPI46114.1 hypothetical protein C5D18_05435 [Rathayibacter tritici]